jgi:alpha/beta superfamily hydrolase
VLLQVAGYVSVGFPLGLLTRMFLRSRAHWDALLESRIPKFLVVGSDDQFTSLSQYNALVHQYRTQHAASAAGVLMDVLVVEGCDHFFGGKWQDVADEVVKWVVAREAVAQVVSGNGAGS